MRKEPWKAADGYTKSGLKIIGGKTGQTKNSSRSLIYRLEPPGIENYIEPFMGSGAITIGNPKIHTLEILNDINPLPIKFFRVLQDPVRWGDFVSWLESLDMTEDFFHTCKNFLTEHNQGIRTLTDFQIAKYYYIVNKYSNNGIVRFNKSGKCNSTFCKTLKGRGLLTFEWAEKIHQRIKEIIIREEDYQGILDIAEALTPEKTLVVVDPPYESVFTLYDRIKFTGLDHEVLAGRLKALRCNWLLTINDTPLIRELYKDNFIMENPVHWCCSNTPGGRGTKIELIIANYNLNKQLKLREATDSTNEQYGNMLKKLAAS